MSDNPNLKHIQDSMTLPQEHKYYFNGYSIVVNAQDFGIALLQNGQPIMFANCPHTIAKSLGKSITDLIEEFEKDAEIVIPYLETVQKTLEKKKNVK